MSTIQLDFQEPQRFELEYVGADNERHLPIMIHRALFGSIERFVAILTEHYAGAFPAWLAPVQVTVVPVADRHEEYAAVVSTALRADGRRVELAPAHSDSLGARIRRAKMEKVPYVLVVGDDDVEHRTVGVNARGSEAPERDVALDDFVARLAGDVDAHVVA
jgi:threonyl-tRNA synthetase